MGKNTDGRTQGAAAFAADMAFCNSIEELCQWLGTADKEGLAPEAKERGLSMAEYKCALRSAMAAKLNRLGIIWPLPDPTLDP